MRVELLCFGSSNSRLSGVTSCPALSVLNSRIPWPLPFSLYGSRDFVHSVKTEMVFLLFFCIFRWWGKRRINLLVILIVLNGFLSTRGNEICIGKTGRSVSASGWTECESSRVYVYVSWRAYGKTRGYWIDTCLLLLSFHFCCCCFFFILVQIARYGKFF